LVNFDAMGPGHFGDDSSNDCLIGPLIVPISCFKQHKNAGSPSV
jgi:hypothetical protein